MYLARVTFGSDHGLHAERGSRYDLAEDYLIELCRSGQICGDYHMGWFQAALGASTHLSRPDAFAERHHADSTIAKFNAVVKAFGRPPHWEIIEDDVPKRFRSWKRSTSLFLYTHAFDFKSPICCGDTGSPIPAYLLPLSSHLCEQIHHWARYYSHFDHIWLRSGSLEIEAYKELADPRSEFSIGGRELCAEIERATAKPTYYLLLRYWGRRQGEAVRPCPGCGGKWHAAAIPNEKAPFHSFHFRCKACRLVSYFARSDDDERHARIGEFSEQKTKLKRYRSKKSDD